MAAAAQRHSGRAEPRTGGGGRPRSAPGRAARPLRAKAAASLRASLRMRRLRRAAPAPPPTRPASAARGSGGDGCHGSSQRPPRCHARNAAQSRALARPECAPIGGRNAGGAGETAFLRFLQRVARADAAHSLHDQWARAKRAAGRAAGGSSLAGGAALRGVCSPCLLAAFARRVCSPPYGRWWAPLHLHSCTRSPRAVGVPVSDNTSYLQPRSAVTALHAHWPSSPHLHSLSSAKRFLITGTIQTCSYSLIKSVKKTPLCIHATGWRNTAHAGTPGGNISLYFAVWGGLDTTTALLALHKSPFQY